MNKTRYNACALTANSAAVFQAPFPASSYLQSQNSLPRMLSAGDAWVRIIYRLYQQ